MSIEPVVISHIPYLTQHPEELIKLTSCSDMPKNAIHIFSDQDTYTSMDSIQLYIETLPQGTTLHVYLKRPKYNSGYGTEMYEELTVFHHNCKVMFSHKFKTSRPVYHGEFIALKLVRK